MNSTVIKFEDFYQINGCLCFVKQPHNEISILIKANFILKYLNNLYPTSTENNKPMVLNEWPYPWSINDGYARLRLSHLNNNDGKNFCNWNINSNNLSDYKSHYHLKDNKEYIYQLLELPEISNILDEILNLDEINKSNLNKLSFRDLIYQAFNESQANLVISDKWVFSLIPNLPSNLLIKGVKNMNNTKIPIFHHREYRIDNVRIGYKDNNLKIPCVDAGGLSNISLPLNDNIFNKTYNLDLIKVCSYRNKELMFNWVKETFNIYLNSKNLKSLSESEYGNLNQSILDLFQDY